MKKYNLIIILAIFVFQSCNSSQTNDKIKILEMKIDSIKKSYDNYIFSTTGMQYDVNGNAWFKIEENGKYYLDNQFYVSNIDTSYVGDGYRIKGSLYNYSSLESHNIILSLSIIDSLLKYNSPVGTTEIGFISAGNWENFDFYIPNKKQNLYKLSIKLVAHDDYSSDTEE